MIEAVRARLEIVIGEGRPFDVEPAPLRCWRIVIYSKDRQRRAMVELDLSEIAMRRRRLFGKLLPTIMQVYPDFNAETELKKVFA